MEGERVGETEASAGLASALHFSARTRVVAAFDHRVIGLGFGRRRHPSAAT